MITVELVQWLIQFGIAGIALYMMYDIANNHLAQIALSLEEIKEILRSSS